MSKLRPEAIRLLIQWPAVLTHFTFETISYGSPVLDYAMLETWLLVHQGTLIDVKIHIARLQGSKAFFNASLFPKLRYLQLWRWPTQPRIQDSGSEDEDLLGHSLETFCWDYSAYDTDGYYEYCPSLGEKEISMIRTLAESAFKRKAALETIIIKYTPGDHLRCSQSVETWEYLKAAKDYMSKFGIDLVYDDPHMSKDDLTHYYATGEVPDGWLQEDLQPVINHAPSYREYTEQVEEELQLEQFYDDLVRDSLHHGENIRKYLLN
jgi:hypothetical protein